MWIFRNVVGWKRKPGGHEYLLNGGIEMSDGATWILFVDDEEVERGDLAHILEMADDYPAEAAHIDIDISVAICLF